MPAADRLAELRRQRMQIQEHLAWLDREIAAEEKNAARPGAPVGTIGGVAATQPVGAPPAGSRGSTDVSAVPTPPASPGPAVAAPPASSEGTGSATAAAEAVQDTDAALAEYQVRPADLQKDVRNGCLLYFAAAVLIFAGIVVVLYYALRR